MRKVLGKLYNDLLKEPLYILFHPIKGFDEFKFYGMGKFYVANVFLILACLLRVISYNGEGFLINKNNPNQFNAIVLVLFILVPVVILTFANWSVTTLFDGKGKLKEIYMMICYCLFPYILIGYPNLLLSNVLTLEEMSFYTMLSGLSIFALCYMAFFGLIGIHEYSVGKTILTIIATVVAAAIIIFIFMLFFTLIQNMFGFIAQVIEELKIKML
jgi:hypothetical protein